MVKIKYSIAKGLVLFLSSILSFGALNATSVDLKGKITMVNGAMPATAILHSSADENFVSAANIDKDGNFSFTVEVPKAILFNIRILNINYDLMLSAAQKSTTLLIKLDGNALQDIQVENSPEDNAYRVFKSLNALYEPKLRAHFVDCEKDNDSCERTLHTLLTEYAHELALISQNFKGTYTADVLCTIKMPLISKNTKTTTEEFRKGYFENLDFSDSTIFGTPVYKEMIGSYVDYIVEPSISKENQFVKYFTEKTKSNSIVFRKSAGIFFDELFKKQREKMLGMYIAWYYTDDHKTQVSNPVLDMRLKGIAQVMPGQPYTDAAGTDPDGIRHTLKETVDKSKCTLLLFWSSECSHCREEMPFIKDYYEKYHAKGFNVFAVSIEPDTTKWRTFVADKKLPWTNIIAGRMADPNPAIQYVSVSTPTMVLIDSKGMILHRFMPKSKLEKHILEALK